MRLLLKAAFAENKYRFLLTITILSMCLVTFASQMEMLTLGVITKKGPDFFELFGPMEEGQLRYSGEVPKERFEARWQELSQDQVITKADTAAFLANWKRGDFIQSVLNRLDRVFPVSGNLMNLALLIMTVALFKAVTLFTHRFSTRLVAIRVSRDLRLRYFEHIQSLPMDFYQKYNIGSLSARVVGDAATISEAMNACLVNYLQTPFTVITTMTLCFLTSWRLSLIIFVGFPLIIYPILFLARKVKKISKQIQLNQERFSTVLIDFLSGIQTVKVFAMEELSLRKYREQNQKVAALEQKSARYDLSSRPIVHTVAMFLLATALLYGLYILQMSVSEVLFFSGLLFVFYEPFKKFAEENTHIQRGAAAAERLFEVMAIEPNIADAKDADSLDTFQESIEFDRVSFRYQDRWILQGLSFTVKKGETVALVGPTGAGKSTIVQLLPRLYDVEKGEIRIDGKPIKEYTQRSLRESIAFVPQKPFLFLDTVAENISFGRRFSEEEIVTAAKRAHADEFIRQLPNGYHTVLSEAGKNLSGGQQQRLAIARALVKNAPILILDEATSSLDSISETHIKEAIKELRGQMTQIIIAHRLSTIEDVDRIIYLEKGRKVAEGTKDELLESCPAFRLMWEHSLLSV